MSFLWRSCVFFYRVVLIKKRKSNSWIPVGGAWRSRTALNGFADRYLTVRTRHQDFVLKQVQN